MNLKLESLVLKISDEVSPDGWLCGSDPVLEFTDLLLAELFKTHQLVPISIHPLDNSNCEAIMQLLQNPPKVARSGQQEPTDYYAMWWEQLLKAAKDIK